MAACIPVLKYLLKQKEKKGRGAYIATSKIVCDSVLILRHIG